MTEDADLLRRYAEARAEDAFAELVRRHLNLVYSAALRQVRGDHSLAEEITQIVFADLARKAASLSHRGFLTGWLYTSTHYAATKAVRGENRRRLREQAAHLMQQTNASTDLAREWEQLQPVLDDAMHELPEMDRMAVLQRYFEGKAFPQIGAALGLTENAARMRVERALDKLRAALGARGVALSGTALAVTLGANAVTAAPVGLASAVLGTAVTAASSSAAAWSWLSAANLKVVLPSLCAVSAAVALWWQYGQARQIQTELARLQGVREQMTELQAERDRLTGLAIDQEELERLRRDQLELLRLRGEVGRLRRELSAAQATASQSLIGSTNAPAVEVDPKQMNIKACFVTGPMEDLAKLGLLEDSTTIFDENQKRQFLKSVKESRSLEFMGEMEVTTLSGRQAQLSATQSATNSEGVKTIGPVLDVLPTLQADGRVIDLSFWGRREEDASYVPVGGDGTLPLPILPSTNQLTRAIVWDGQTVAATKRIAGKSLVMLITPRLIDRAGNPVHAEIDLPIVEEKSFQH